jgi:hypothetical protein
MARGNHTTGASSTTGDDQAAEEERRTQRMRGAMPSSPVPTFEIEWNVGDFRLIRVFLDKGLPTRVTRLQLWRSLGLAENLEEATQQARGIAADYGLALSIIETPDHTDPLGQWVTVAVSPRERPGRRRRILEEVARDLDRPRQRDTNLVAAWAMLELVPAAGGFLASLVERIPASALVGSRSSSSSWRGRSTAFRSGWMRSSSVADVAAALGALLGAEVVMGPWPAS